MLDGRTLVTRRPGMIEADAGGELIGLHIEQGTCYGFNATATRLWQLIETPRTVDDLCAVLTAEYDVEDAQCRSDLAPVIAMLADDGLVALSRD